MCTKGGHSKNTEDRFWEKVDIGGVNDCWNWKAFVRRDGYGKFYFRGSCWAAHRVSFVLAGNELTKDKPCVLHRCDNKLCVNPNHLFAGTYRDNIMDCINKGRFRVGFRGGENSYKSTLTNREVLEMRDLYRNDVLSTTEISQIYPISLAGASNICRMRRRIITN